MPTLEALRDLLARVERAEGPDREMDARLYAAFLHAHGFERMGNPDQSRSDPRSYVWHDDQGSRMTCWGDKAFTYSIDAAVALVEHVSPCIDLHFFSDAGSYFAYVEDFPEYRFVRYSGFDGGGADRPLWPHAILSAWLRFLLKSDVAHSNAPALTLAAADGSPS